METTAVPRLLPHLWKSTLVSGILALALGILVLVWPGDPSSSPPCIFGDLSADHRARASCLRVQPARLRGRAGAVVHQRRRLAGVGRAVLPTLRRRLRNSAAGHLDRRRLHLPWCGDVDIGHQRSRTCPVAAGRYSSVLISLLAGIVMIGSPFRSLAILTLIVGIWLIVIGVFEIVSSFGIRSASNRVDKALAGDAHAAGRRIVIDAINSVAIDHGYLLH